MDPTLLLLVVFTIVAGTTDLILKKIHNITNVSVFIIAGIIIAIEGGSFVSSFLGAVISFLAMLPLFYFGIVAGGDVKMMTVLGFIVGYPAVIDTLVMAIILSAFLALIILTVDGRIVILVYRIKSLFMTLFFPKVKIYFPDVKDALNTPIAFALGLAAILNYTEIWKGFL